ncbi:MAG: superoxide dismutase [Alphaproteobacteria bacterium]|nr:superoxide dismutase [Alphaproteobacteria bacterium]
MSAFELPELPYAYDALDPYMSAETLEYHHDKHHKAYVDNGNKALEGLVHMGDTLEAVVLNAHKSGNQGLFNNAGQHWNHTHFWNWMKPNGGGALPGNLEKAIQDSFESYDSFRVDFIQGGASQFGSGWVWLVMNSDGKLEILKTANADNPLTHGKTALLGCDVWEHSYYIDYRNARPKYLEAFIDHMVNWDYVAELFEKGPLKIAA